MGVQWSVSLPLETPSRVRILPGASTQGGLRGGRSHCEYCKNMVILPGHSTVQQYKRKEKNYSNILSTPEVSNLNIQYALFFTCHFSRSLEPELLKRATIQVHKYLLLYRATIQVHKYLLLNRATIQVHKYLLLNRATIQVHKY